ncbi:hypothetical protein LAM24_24130, partial [Mycobacterium tuberculosis]|nr:hypothetical protein [Mycobacterium tuberculosis]
MAPEVSCPAALRLPGRGVGFRGAFREKTPTALKQEGRLASLTGLLYPLLHRASVVARILRRVDPGVVIFPGKQPFP